MNQSRRNLLSGLVAGSALATLGPDASPAQTVKHLPLCKDCRFFQAAEASPHSSDAYRALTSTCSHDIPDFITGGASFPVQMPWLAQNMRIAGPCGMEAYLFEPKESE